MSYEEFRKRIDTARQILVGAVPSPAGQIDQITYALMYKFMNDIDDQAAALGGRRTYFTDDYAKYNWHELMKPGLEAHDQLELYRQAIQGMSKNPGLPPLFREIYQNAFLPFNSPNVLRLFLEEINKFNHGDSDDIGDAYEYLLSITGAQGDVGQFRTPRHIIKFIVEAVGPTKDDTVLDPAVGTAGFLIAAYNHVKSQHDGKDGQGNANDEKRLTADELEKLHHNYRGFDIDPTMVRTASVNMYLHGFTSPDIRNHDSLSSEDYWNDRYDVILANPPFMTPKGGIQPHKKFSISANRAEVLFVDYIASHLKPTGRAGVIVPEGIIFQSGKAYKELRKNLVENYLYAVISLPSGVFMPYTGVKTSILLLDKEFAKQRDEILFIDIKHVGVSLGATARKIDDNDMPKALDLIKAFKAGAEIVSSPLAFNARKHDIRSSVTYDLRQSLYRKYDAKDHEIEFVELKEVASIKKGKSSSTKTNPGEYPLILTAAEAKTAEYYDFDGDGVAVPLISSLGHGKAEIKRIHRAKGQFALANLLCFIEPLDRDKLDPNFLFHVLNASKKSMAHLMSGAANVSMNISDVERFKIPLPSIETQREIVAELDGYQKIIDAAQTIIKTYKPTISISGEQHTISEFAQIKGGKRLPKSETFTDDQTARPYIRVVDMMDGSINLSDLRFISDAIFQQIKNYTISSNDVYISIAGTIGRVGTIPEKLDGASLTENAAKLVFDNAIILPKYLVAALNTDLVQEQIKKSTMGVGVPKLALSRIADISIPLPPIETQRKIVAELDSERQLIDANKKIIEIYQQKIKSKLAEIWGE